MIEILTLKNANGRSINSIERKLNREELRLQNDRFNNNVKENLKDIKNKGYCYCHNEDEIKEISRTLGQINIEDVIIEGEKYEGIWKVSLK